MTEKDFQASIIQFAKLRGWLCYHTYDSRKCEPGFPDLVLIRGKRILYRELKTDKGRLTPAQKIWGNALDNAGADWAVWRPAMKSEIWEVLM